jgi:acyl carrier protein
VSGDGLERRVEQVFREVFEDPALSVGAATTAADIPRWDSLEHINLIMALEREFGVEFTSAEVTSMSRVGDLYPILRAKMGRS